MRRLDFHSTFAQNPDAAIKELAVLKVCVGLTSSTSAMVHHLRWQNPPRFDPISLFAQYQGHL